MTVLESALWARPRKTHFCWNNVTASYANVAYRNCTKLENSVCPITLTSIAWPWWVKPNLDRLGTFLCDDTSKDPPFQLPTRCHWQGRHVVDNTRVLVTSHTIVMDSLSRSSCCNDMDANRCGSWIISFVQSSKYGVGSHPGRDCFIPTATTFIYNGSFEILERQDRPAMYDPLSHQRSIFCMALCCCYHYCHDSMIRWMMEAVDVSMVVVLREENDAVDAFVQIRLSRLNTLVVRFEPAGVAAVT